MEKRVAANGFRLLITLRKGVDRSSSCYPVQASKCRLQRGLFSDTPLYVDLNGLRAVLVSTRFAYTAGSPSRPRASYPSQGGVKVTQQYTSTRKCCLYTSINQNIIVEILSRIWSLVCHAVTSGQCVYFLISFGV